MKEPLARITKAIRFQPRSVVTLNALKRPPDLRITNVATTLEETANQSVVRGSMKIAVLASGERPVVPVNRLFRIQGDRINKLPLRVRDVVAPEESAAHTEMCLRCNVVIRTGTFGRFRGFFQAFQSITKQPQIGRLFQRASAGGHREVRGLSKVFNSLTGISSNGPKLGSCHIRVWDRDSFSLRLLEYVRDEAHRFAQHYHHLLRGKRFTSE